MRSPLPFLALLVLASCAPAQRPVSFAEQMARESAELPVAIVKSPDESFSTKILGGLSRPMRPSSDKSGIAAEIDIGSTAPVECVFFDQDLDLASALIEFSDRTFDELTRSSGPVSARRIQQTSADSIGAAPMLSLAWRYRVGSGVGLIKHRIASVDGHGLYCRHVETGYRRTFRQLFESIARNLRRADTAQQTPLHATVARTRLRGKARGIEKHLITEVGDGSVRLESRYSMLTSSQSGQLSALDTVFVRFAKPDGSLINGVYARSEDGKLVTNLALDPRGRGWLISGLLDGVEISREIDAGEALVTTLGDVQALQKAIRDQGSSASFELRGWYPNLDPGQVQRRVVIVGQRQDADHFNVISQIGAVVIESVVDLDGQTTWSRWLDTNLGELQTERLFVEGRLGRSEISGR